MLLSKVLTYFTQVFSKKKNLTVSSLCHYTRPSTKDHKRTCAIVFDEKNCDYDDGVDDAFEEVTEGRTVLDDGNQV